MGTLPDLRRGWRLLHRLRMVAQVGLRQVRRLPGAVPELRGDDERRGGNEMITPQEMAEAGIMFSVPGLDGCGWHHLAADRIEEFVQDKVGVYAAIYDITREHVEAWMAFIESDDRQCRASTVRGHRCKGFLDYPYGAVGPIDFDPDVHLFCRYHQENPATLWNPPPCPAP
jgi:hypothetical protein